MFAGAKFEMIIVSEKFVGVKLLERQRLVQGALGDKMNEIHAITMKTWTPEQWEKKKSNYES